MHWLQYLFFTLNNSYSNLSSQRSHPKSENRSWPALRERPLKRCWSRKRSPVRSIMMFCGTSTARAVGATPPSKLRMCLPVALAAKSWPAARSSQTRAILASQNLQASWARGEDLMKSESVVYFYFFHLVTVGSWCALQLFLLFHSLKPLSLSLCSNGDLLQVAKRLFCSSDKGRDQKGCSFALGGLHFSSCRPPNILSLICSFGWPSQSFPPGESLSSIQCQDCLSAITWHPVVHAGSLPLLQLIVLQGSKRPCERSNEYMTDAPQDHDFYTLSLKDNFSLCDVFPPVHFVNDNY